MTGGMFIQYLVAIHWQTDGEVIEKQAKVWPFNGSF